MYLMHLNEKKSQVKITNNITKWPKACCIKNLKLVEHTNVNFTVLKLLFFVFPFSSALSCLSNLNLFFLLTEINRQVQSNMCEMGARLRESVSSVSCQWEYVPVQCGAYLRHHSATLPATQTGRELLCAHLQE